MSAGAGAPVGPSAAGGATRFNEELYDQFWNDCPTSAATTRAPGIAGERFQMKCRARMEQFRRSGKTVFLVSHALATVRENCRRAIWIHEGRLVRDGDATSVTELYHRWSVGEQVSLPQAL